MTPHAAATETAERPRTLVWINSRGAVLARWDGTGALIYRLSSDVPVHRRSTGHVTRRAATGTGGLAPQPDGEGRRLEHLARFLHEVAARIAEYDEVEILGPGPVHERLAGLLRQEDAAHHRGRSIVVASAGPMTDPQLLARLRETAGVHPRRGRRPGRWLAAARHERRLLPFPEEEETEGEEEGQE